ncbi:hypothetical protein DIPPA_35642 [Diplonema papillatum]|nr:hypothetical protein DIPPA_35642 [Diplonema papillatum]
MLGSPLPVLLAAVCYAAAGVNNTVGPTGPPYALADDILGDDFGGTGLASPPRSPTCRLQRARSSCEWQLAPPSCRRQARR